MALSFDSSDGGILSVDSHRVVPAPFLTKTYQLVDDPVSNDIVSWGEDGSTFVVWRPPEFARDLLPNYFKHNNFSSFVRQLNTYGFRKVVPDRWEFANDFFRKGERHLLCEIHRRKAQCSLAHLQHYGGGSCSPSSSGEDLPHPQLACTGVAAGTTSWSPLSASSPLHSPTARGICGTAAGIATSLSLSDENERLRRDNCLLLSELARLQKLYDDALLFLHHNMRLGSGEDHLHHHPRITASIAATTSTTNMVLGSRHLQQQQQQQNQIPRQHLPPPPPPPTQVNQEQQQQHSSSNLIGGGGGVLVGKGCGSKFDGATPRASTIDFVDVKLREVNAAAAAAAASHRNSLSPPPRGEDQVQVLDDQGRKSSGTKLFGVVLHGRKRLHPDQGIERDGDCDHDQDLDHDHQAAAPSLKSAKIELELMPSTAVSSTEAPWLKLRASRDERVCI